MSLAADVREAVRERPFLLSALRAGLLNYAAAAEWLVDDASLDGGTDAIATALRRFESDLPAYATTERSASVTMRSGVGAVERSNATDSDDPPLLSVGERAVVPEGRETAVIATGDVDANALSAVLARFATAEVDVSAAAVAGDALAVVVDRRDGATAVRIVEATLERVPDL